MKSFLYGAFGAFFIGVISAGASYADSTVAGLATATTSPLPAGSCFYVDQGPGTDTKLCSGWAAAIGAVATADLGSGVETFLTTPAGAIDSSWLESGAAVANLGFTPVPDTRTVTGTGMLADGGDLTANRTITLAATAANTVVANATGSSAVPTAVTLPACADTGGNHLNYASGAFSCGTSSSGGIDLSAVTNGSIIYDDAGALNEVTLGSGLAMSSGTLTLSEVANNETTTARTVGAGDANETVYFTNAGASTANITAAATLGAGFGVYIDCQTAAGCTIDPAGSETVNGASTLALKQYQKSWLKTYNGTSWTASVEASIDPSNASNLNSGTVAVARGGAGTVNGVMKANGSGVVSAAVDGTDFTLVTATTCPAGQKVDQVLANGDVRCAAESGGGTSGILQFGAIGTSWTSANNYVGHGNSNATAVGAWPIPAPFDGNLSNLVCWSSIAPSGGTFVWTINIAGSDNSNVTAVIPDGGNTSTSGNNTPVAVTKGQLLVVHATTVTGTPNSRLTCTVQLAAS